MGLITKFQILCVKYFPWVYLGQSLVLLISFAFFLVELHRNTPILAQFHQPSFIISVISAISIIIHALIICRNKPYSVSLPKPKSLDK